MIAQMMQRLFGPVFQGAGPVLITGQVGEQAGIFAGIIAEEDDSPPIPDAAGELAAAVQAANGAATDMGLTTAMTPAQNADAAQGSGSSGKPKVEQPQKLTARIMLGSPPSGQSMETPPNLGEPVVENGFDAGKQDLQVLRTEGAAGTARIMLGHGDGPKATVLPDASLLAPASSPDMAENTDPNFRGKTGLPPEHSDPAQPSEAVAAVADRQGVIPKQEAVSPDLRSLPTAAPTPKEALDGAVKLTAIEGRERAFLAGAPNASQGSFSALTDGFIRTGRAESATQTASARDIARPKAPPPMGAIAALQAFVQGGGQGAATIVSDVTPRDVADGDVAIDDMSVKNTTARNAAFTYAFTTPNGAQKPDMVAAALAGQLAGIEQDAVDAYFGDENSIFLGDGRSGVSSISNPTSPTSGILAGQTPTAAQLSAQIIPMVQSGRSGPLELLLSPVELGHMRFEIHHRGEQVQIVLSAERPETLDLLRRNSEQLLTDFRNAGFEGASLSFGHWGSGQNADTSPQGFQADPQSESSSARSMAASADVLGPREAPSSLSLDSARSLNLRL